MKKFCVGLVLFLALIASPSSFAFDGSPDCTPDCKVFIIGLTGPYSHKVSEALTSRGYSVVRSMHEADYTVTAFGATRGIVWRITAQLEDPVTGEQFLGEGKAIFANRAFSKGIAKLPLCPPTKK
jgi:hypothetical protein